MHTIRDFSKEGKLFQLVKLPMHLSQFLFKKDLSTDDPNTQVEESIGMEPDKSVNGTHGAGQQLKSGGNCNVTKNIKVQQKTHRRSIIRKIYIEIYVSLHLTQHHQRMK